MTQATETNPRDNLLEELKSICQARKRDYLASKEKIGGEHPDTCYARGVYFGLLVALRVANGGGPIRI